MQYRNELKHLITSADRAAICAVMKTVAHLDPHAGEKGYYSIRSLYFDSIADKALREKQDGVNRREKFRIRYYDGNTSVIHLEKKVKRDSLGYKVTCDLTADEAGRIAAGDTLWMASDRRALVVELYVKMKTQGLRPKTIVDYERIPFVYGPGNVRVTVDYNIRTGIRCTDFLNPQCVTVPAAGQDIVLEVKWDGYLPDVIRHAVQLKGRYLTAYSKYGVSRIYG
ncbi:MAG: polyphosphate polymerase domain-containing protein [Oscillospiraceae bacterium]|nr:polyphosphate polymerase domain-containing protein [Oscillospiraceae bacterium]